MHHLLPYLRDTPSYTVTPLLPIYNVRENAAPTYPQLGHP